MTKSLLSFVVSILLACGACTSKYPTVPLGDRISGNVWYQGSALASMTRPTIRVFVGIDFPPSAQPYGMVTVERPNLAAELTGAGVPYEITWLLPYQYKVYGQLIDFDVPDVDATLLPTGGYPDYCTLVRPGEGMVTVSEAEPSSKIDFFLYDQTGAADPCTAAVCPPTGKSTMNILVQSSQMPTGNDQLRVALFQTFPSMTPASVRLIPGGGLTFPHVVMDNGLSAGDYALLYVCLDIGANSGAAPCTSEDFVAIYQSPSPPLYFPVDQIVNLVADLDAGTVIVTGVDSPSVHGCP
jgi:hypothetical protein